MEFGLVNSSDSTCAETYIYHSNRSAGRAEENFPDVHNITDQEALNDGWLPIATYTLHLIENQGAFTSSTNSDGVTTAESLNTSSAIYEDYDSTYRETLQYLEETLGTCHFARGDAYNPETGFFEAPTGHGLYGFNTFYIKEK